MSTVVSELFRAIGSFDSVYGVLALLVVVPLLAWIWLMQAQKGPEFLYLLLKDRLTKEQFFTLCNRFLLFVFILGILATIATVSIRGIDAAAGPKSKTVHLNVFQGGSLYEGRCSVKWQLPDNDIRTDEIHGGSMPISGVSADATTISVWGIEAFGSEYTPRGMTESRPWVYAIDSANSVTVDLGPKPMPKRCAPPSPDEMKERLADSGRLNKVQQDVTAAKSKESRQAIRKKAHLRVANLTKMDVNLIGMDCKKLFEPPNAFSLEDSDWLDFLQFKGLDAREELDFSRFHEMPDSSGLFCLFACVPVPDGRKAVFLGVFDFFEHEESRYKLVLNGSKELPIIFVPDTSENNP